MASETIVAVFDTAAHAEAAIADLVAHGIPSTSIEHYAQTGETTGATTGTISGMAGTDTQPHKGLWAWLTGDSETSTTQHTALYDQSIQSGGTVVTVISDGVNIDKIYSVLETHNPVDLDERHSQYAASGAYGATTGMATAPVAATGTGTGTEEVLSLSEESLQVGKREVDRGTTRVRRYVVERPVEEQIRLRNETVSIFRRPVTAGAAVGTDAFTDRVITMNETDEEAVIAKSAHVVEEVVVQKAVEERVETVRDTLRREEVEIAGPTTTGVAGTTTGAAGTMAGTTSTTTTPGAKPLPGI